MKINSLIIDGIGGIKHLDLHFKDGLNVICGANGIGKSTILNTISDAFNRGWPSRLKRNALCTEGTYFINIDTFINNKCQQKEIKVSINSFQAIEMDTPHRFTEPEEVENFLFFGIERNINYFALDSIHRDPHRDLGTIGNMATTGVKANDIKDWFINRYLFKDKSGSLEQQQINNYNIAETTFSVLDNTIKFKTVKADTLDIILSTSNGDIYFEYLSSGYKSCIYIIMGIIKEIEYRNNAHPIDINDFNGVVLIDEIDLHLHPIWQAGLVKALKKIFPHVQFILTTHSPSVLQSLEKDEIIALGYDENNNTYIKELNLGKYGLQGWTLEEILQDVMDMPSTSSQLYLDTMKKFDTAMDNEDKEEILKQYRLLNEMLHPNSRLRRLLSIQVAEWED